MGGGEKRFNTINIYIIFKKLSKGLFSHQMLMIYQGMFLSLKSRIFSVEFLGHFKKYSNLVFIYLLSFYYSLKHVLFV